MGISDSDDRPTPRTPRSVTEDGYYPAAADPDPNALEAVLELAPLLDSISREHFRDKLSEIVCNFYTLLPFEEQLRAPAMIRLDRAGQEGAPEPSARTKRPIVIHDLGMTRDLEDLSRLREFFETMRDEDGGEDNAWMLRAIDERLDEFYEANKTLEFTLRAGLFAYARRSGVKTQLRSGDCSRIPEVVSAWIARIDAVAADVKLESDRRARASRRPDLAQRTFVFDMLIFWHQFTGRGASRHNADGLDSGPFHRFLQAAGRLVVANFNGKRLARDLYNDMKSEGYFDC